MIGQLPALLATLVVGASDAPAATPPPPQQPEVTVTGTQPDDLPMTISWNAPDECPGIAELKAEIRRVAGVADPEAAWSFSLETLVSGLRAQVRRHRRP